MTESKKVVIVGGGISGLAAAFGFGKCGWAVTLLEQAESFSVKGAGFLLQANGLIALDALGLGKKIRQHGVPLPALAMRGRRGLRYFSTEFALGLPPDLHLLSIRRSDLHAVLLNACLSVNVDLRLGYKVLGVSCVEPTGSCVVCSFQGEEISLTATLVVGADGVRSIVRDSIGISVDYEMLNEGSVHGIVPFTGGSPMYGAYFGNGEGAGQFPIAGGSTFWFWGRPGDEINNLKEQSFQQWKKKVSKTFPPLCEVLNHYNSWSEISRYIHHVVRCSTWSVRNTVVIGDAAHAMSPSVGQGANSALVDALSLVCHVVSARSLVDGGMQEALAGFETERRPIVETFQSSGKGGGIFGARSKIGDEIKFKMKLVAARFLSRSQKEGLIRHISGLVNPGFELTSIGITKALPW